MEKRQLIEDSDEESQEHEDIARDYLRISVVLSFLTHKELKIKLVDQIRPFEVSLLKMITKVTDRTRTEVDKHFISLKPGILVGGDFVFECDKSMPLSYYLEPLVLLLPFTSQSSSIILNYSNLDFKENKNVNGTSSNNTSMNNANNHNVGDNDDNLYLNNEFYSSLECFCSVCTVILQMIGCEVNFKFKEPHEVVFTCKPIKKIEPISLTKSPKIKRVRGSVLVRNLQPNLGKRAIIGAKRVLDIVCDNTWISLSSPPGRLKPLLMVSLIAEGTKNCIFTSHSSFYYKIKDNKENHEIEEQDQKNEDKDKDINNKKENHKSSLKQILNLALNNDINKDNNQLNKIKRNNNTDKNATNTNKDNSTNQEIKEMEVDTFENVYDECENIGEKCAYRLCTEISLDSVIDTTHQHLLLFFMSLSGDHQVSKVRLAKLNRYSVYLMRLIKIHLGVIFKFEEIESSNGNNVLIVKCIGSNFQNINIKSF